MRFDANDVEEFCTVLQDLWQNSEVGREYLRGYYVEEDFQEHFDLIRSATTRMARGTNVSDDDIEHALYLLITTGRIKPRKAAAAPLEEAPVDTRPRDKNGKLLTEAQIAWGEMTRWANEHSSDECRKRATKDPAFKQFMQTRLRQEMDRGAEGVVVAKQSAATASADLVNFATAYNKAPAQSLRPINGTVTLDGKMYPFAEFNALVEQASKARLIF